VRDLVAKIGRSGWPDPCGRVSGCTFQRGRRVHRTEPGHLHDRWVRVGPATLGRRPPAGQGGGVFPTLAGAGQAAIPANLPAFLAY
jgi:hypothetical protein